MDKIVMSAWLIMALALSACKTYQANQLPATQLRFGSGGGFTGAVTEYVLLENGQIFVRESLNGDYQPLGKVKKERAKALYQTWETSGLAKKTFEHPGNMYYFVTMAKDGEEHRLSWGSHNHPAGDELKAFYKECSALVKELKIEELKN